MMSIPLILLGLFVFIGSSMHPQLSEGLSTPQQVKTMHASETPAAVLADVENAIKAGDMKIFSKYVSTKVYLNLRGGESGYYSGNHAAYLVQNFFGARRTITFKLSTVKDTESMPYATGSGTFIGRGSQEKLQVYVALGEIDGKWVITQFSVY